MESVPLDQAPPYQVEELTADSLAYLQQVYAKAEGFGLTSIRQVEEFFQTQRAQWHASPEEQRGDPSAVIELVGVVAGVFLGHEARLNWVWYSDHQGAEFALYAAQHPAGLNDVVLFPVNSMAKRWFDPSTSGPFVWINESISMIYQRIFYDAEARTSNRQRLTEVLDRVGANNPSRQEHVLAFPRLEDLQQAAEQLRRTGWLVAQPQTDPAVPQSWLLRASRSDQQLNEATSEYNRCFFGKIACDFAATYRGWDAYAVG